MYLWLRKEWDIDNLQTSGLSPSTKPSPVTSICHYIHVATLSLSRSLAAQVEVQFRLEFFKLVFEMC